MRGPERDGISKETGLLKEWPKDGPKLLWQVKDVGGGYSTPAVVGDRFYLLGDRSNEEFVQALARFREVCSAEREKVVAAGGLHILGTERHESRRIDNQLRGRSGRQGDPGETQFFVSLEDNLMRVFAADTIKNLMGRFGIPEDEPIQNSLVTRALESAQTKIEGFNFDARKHVLEFDNVLDKQRRAIYERRRKILQA